MESRSVEEIEVCSVCCKRKKIYQRKLPASKYNAIKYFCEDCSRY